MSAQLDTSTYFNSSQSSEDAQCKTIGKTPLEILYVNLGIGLRFALTPQEQTVLR